MSEDRSYFDGVVPVWKALACELKDTSPEGSWVITKLLLLANIVLFVVFWQYMQTYTTAYRAFPYPVCVLSGTCWPQIINGMFAHADIIHLIGNMFFLYIVGDNVEITFGKIKYFLIYFVSGLVAVFTQSMFALILSQDTLGVLMVGASGAISGLIGAYLLTYPGSAMCYCIGCRVIFKCFKVRATTYLGIWILFQFVYPFIASNVAIVAHLGGLVTGAALALLLADKKRIGELRVRIWRGFVRGLDPGENELRRHSLSAIGAGGLVLATLFLIGISAMAIYCVPSYDNEFAIVYGVIGHEPNYGTHITEVRTLFTNNRTLVDKAWVLPDAAVFAVLRTDLIAEITVAAALATIAASAYLIHAIMKGKHREIEVTYIPPDIVRKPKTVSA